MKLALSLLLALSALADPVTNSIGMQLKRVAAGDFSMGLGGGEFSRTFQDVFAFDHAGFASSDERPNHPVIITRAFDLGMHEVTRGQFAAFVAATGYRTSAERSGKGIVGWHNVPEREGRPVRRPFDQHPQYTWKNPGFAQTDEHPVVGVSWDDAQAFCRWLSNKEGANYRLPTEAEWEYACKASTDTIYSWGHEHRGHFQKFANLADASMEAAHPKTAAAQWYLTADPDGAVYTAPVGRYRANPFGIHDLHRNVWEWCQDIYAESTYQRSKRNGTTWDIIVDPMNDSVRWHEYEGFEWRVVRGGSWAVAPQQVRSTVRGYLDQKDATCYTGFRVVREIPIAEQAQAQRVHHQVMASRAALNEASNITFDAHGIDNHFIRLNADRPTVEQTAHFPRIPRVTHLSMNANNALTQQAIADIGGMTRLQALKLSNCDGVDSGFEPLASLTDLRECHLRRCAIMPADLRRMPWLTNLRTLSFGNSNIGDSELAAFHGLQFPNLVDLHLNDSAVTGTGLAAFAGAPYSA